MPACATCGNEYDKAFLVTMPGGRSDYFDSFECAIARFAPTCARCGCRVIGHGAESDGIVYCCAHCATHAGVPGIDDRAD